MAGVATAGIPVATACLLGGQFSSNAKRFPMAPGQREGGTGNGHDTGIVHVSRNVLVIERPTVERSAGRPMDSLCFQNTFKAFSNHFREYLVKHFTRKNARGQQTRLPYQRIKTDPKDVTLGYTCLQTFVDV
jgi:hypothetical protein